VGDGSEAQAHRGGPKAELPKKEPALSRNKAPPKIFFLAGTGKQGYTKGALFLDCFVLLLGAGKKKFRGFGWRGKKKKKKFFGKIALKNFFREGKEIRLDFFVSGRGPPNLLFMEKKTKNSKTNQKFEHPLFLIFRGGANRPLGAPDSRTRTRKGRRIVGRARRLLGEIKQGQARGAAQSKAGGGAALLIIGYGGEIHYPETGL